MTDNRVDPRTPPDMLVNGGALKLALNALRRSGKDEIADELEKTTTRARHIDGIDDTEALRKARHDTAHAKTEQERVLSLAYWLDQQKFEPGMLSCAAETLRAFLRSQEQLPQQAYDLAHVIWAAAQTAPGEGIVDAVERIVGLLPANVASERDGCSGLDGLPVPYPNPDDVTPAMRKGFERLFYEANKRYHSTLERNEKGAYRDLRTASDWQFYQRAWADALVDQLQPPNKTETFDEREAFEAWFVEKAKTLPILHDATLERYPGGQYINDLTLFGMMVWQARADLNVQDESGELLPCPFCGADAFATYKTGYDDMKSHSVFCSNRCGAQVRDKVSEDAAVAAWNRRT